MSIANRISHGHVHHEPAAALAALLRAAVASSVQHLVAVAQESRAADPSAARPSSRGRARRAQVRRGSPSHRKALPPLGASAAVQWHRLLSRATSSGAQLPLATAAVTAV